MLSQFTPEQGSRWGCLAEFITMPGVYAAGRLDADSEGLLLLTDQGRLQQRLTDPTWGHWRRYWVQVEGLPTTAALESLRNGLLIQGKVTLPARARQLSPDEVQAAQLAERDPPIRHRLNVPTSWLALELREGRNRQVRRMTAAVGFPTLRLLRMAMDLMDGLPPLSLEGLKPGEHRSVSAAEAERLSNLLRPQAPGPRSPGRGGRAGGGKSGRAGGGG